MSVQLIVYPQSYNGGFNEISTSPTEFLVNGINFNGLDTTGTYTSGATSPYPDTLSNAYPSIANTWYRFRTNTSGTPDYPSVLAGDLALKSVAGIGSVAGVYQQLSNLTIGAQYTITLNINTVSTGSITVAVAIGQPSPVNIYSGATYPVAAQITHTFIAVLSNDIVLIGYENTVDDTVVITSTSIQPVIGAIPSGATNVLDNGQVLCDLYEDEDIPLSLSVDDFKNVAEKVQSYSKAFNLPATKRNNRIFDNIFEITRSNDGIIFNPYKKTKCVLKQDGFILFEGYLRMLDVTDKKGETSYNVNLYSEVVALADVLGDRAFRDLDFTELEHDYNRTQIVNSWLSSGTGITYTNPSTSGFRDANNTVKYPFVDWNHQFILGASGTPVLSNLETAFRPFINIKYLIDRIFEATPFTYESAFFDTTDFGKLYMDFNWGGDEPVSGIGTVSSGDPIVDSTGSYQPLKLYSNNFPDNVGYDPTTSIFTAEYDNQSFIIDAEFNVGTLISPDVKFTWTHYDASGAIINNDLFIPNNATTNGSNCLWAFSLSLILNLDDTLKFEYISPFQTAQQQASHLTLGTNSVILTNNLLLQSLRGELGQWDFLKGLITMFNLVTLPDEDNPNNILIEPYSDVFIPTATGGQTLANRGIEHDWTDKIDVSEMKLTPLTDLNKKTIFKFVEDDDDYSFNQYKRLVGSHLYGSKNYNAGDEFNILFGEDEIVAEPFAATVVKPLMSQYPDFITPALYSMNDDGVAEGFENSPRIMYNNGIKDTGTTYYIPAQNGVVYGNYTQILQFSHLSDVPTVLATPSVAGSKDFHFGECQLMTGVGSAVPDNLFNLYWLPYYSELYNPNTRIMTIKVNLNPADINRFKFNDKVYIKNRVFRVNKIDYKPNDLATVEFILIP